MVLGSNLLWFSHDLRLEDNWALFNSIQDADNLICVYVVDPKWFAPHRFGDSRLGNHRWRFLLQSLVQLDHRLQRLQQRLLLLVDDPENAISRLVDSLNIQQVHRSFHTTTYERLVWQRLRRRFPLVQFVQSHGFTLFTPEQLPFTVEQLPPTFTRFRKLVETIEIEKPLAAPMWLPTSPLLGEQYEQHHGAQRLSTLLNRHLTQARDDYSERQFLGGEDEGQQRLNQYFVGTLASRYKETRNAIDDWDSSTKFSPWLANGTISARTIAARLRRYEQDVIANESTYWILFELLWREYFQWYSLHHHHKLFRFGGISNKVPLTSSYSGRFRTWCAGATPYPLVNACMHQLNAIGYLSNRGRQIVASCLVNELELDWRFGAAYFEQQLIDYDPAVNWGNWQYIAGVGADQHGGRHFNLSKQTALYDPEGDFIRRWGGDETVLPLDPSDYYGQPTAVMS